MMSTITPNPTRDVNRMQHTQVYRHRILMLINPRSISSIGKLLALPGEVKGFQPRARMSNMALSNWRMNMKFGAGMYSVRTHVRM